MNQILHIDYDSFFASVEQQANPYLRNRPIAVTGSSVRRGVVCTASVQAKRLGIKTGMPMYQAKELCPELICIRGDSTKYSYVHKKSLEIYQKYTDLVEPFSIDEAFLDVTATAKFFRSAENIAYSIKKDVLAAFGEYITCSIGIAPNKMLAKLVSDINKPDGLYVLTDKNLTETLQSVELRDFCGIGWRLEKRLNDIGIQTVQDLQETSLQDLYHAFGKAAGSFLKDISSGKDFAVVANSDYRRTPKSMSHNHTLMKNTRNPQEILAHAQKLTEMIAERLRRHKMKGKLVYLALKNAHKEYFSQSYRLGNYTNSGVYLYQGILVNFKKLNFKEECRFVSVGVTDLVHESTYMRPLFDLDYKNEKINETLDKINDKWGHFSMVPASTLRTDNTKRKISSFLRYN